MQSFLVRSCLALLWGAAALTAAEVVDAVRPVWTGGEAWTVFWPADKGDAPWSVARQGDRCELSVRTCDKDLELPFYEGYLKGAVTLTGALELTQEVELLEGENVELGLILVDAQNELFVFTRRPLTPGKHALQWKLPDDVTVTWPMGGPANRQVDGFLRPWENTVAIRANSRPARLRWGPATVRERKPLLDSVSVSISTGHPIHLVLLPEAREKPVATVANSAAREVRLRFEARVLGWDGELGALTRDLVLPAGGKEEIALPDTGMQPGIRWVDTTLVDGDLRQQKRLSYALMTPTRNPPGHREQGFLFSICTHASWWARDLREKEFLALSLVGTDMVRDGPGWAQIEPEKGRYHWEMLDEMMDLADAHGTEIQGNTGNCAKWAALPEKQANPNHLVWLFSAPVLGWDEWARFNEAYAARTRGRIRYIEIGNETDLEFFWNGTTDEYIQYLRLAYGAIKRAAPETRVMTCGFSGIGPHDGKKLNPDMQERVLREAQDAFDIHAFHQHGFFSTFQPVVEAELPKLRTVLREPRPIYYNETAMYCSPTISEQTQAETLYKKLLLAWGTGGIGFTWYDLRNDGTDPANPEHNFGMITQDYRPKAVYVAFNTLASLLGEARCTGRLDLGRDAYGFRFHAGTQHVVGAWIEKPEVSDRLVALRVGTGATAATVDLMGVETPLPVVDGVVLWTATHAARFLVVHGGDAEPALLPPPVAAPLAVLAEPGQPQTIAIGLANPLPREAVIRLEWALPECLPATAGAASETRLPAGGAGTVDLVVLPGRRPAGAPHDQPIPVTARWSIPGTPWQGELAVPVQLRLVVPKDGLTAAEPVFRMATRDRVTNLFDNDPSGLAHVWKGPQDLSGAVWMGREGDALIVRIAVDDDVHRQPNPVPEMWKADSIQVGVMVPGQPSQWEFGFARGDDGKAFVHTWLVPQGQQDPTARITLATAPRAGGLDYTARIPLDAIGLAPEHLAQGFRFNLIVNDDDTGPRKGWIHLAPGIGDRKDPGPWPELRME